MKTRTRAEVDAAIRRSFRARIFRRVWAMALGRAMIAVGVGILIPGSWWWVAAAWSLLTIGSVIRASEES